MNGLQGITPIRTVCFTGHRPDRLPKDYGQIELLLDRLTDAIVDAVGRGKDTFVSGAMSGFDIIAAEQVLMLKKKHPHIKCVIVQPFSYRFFENDNWTEAWRNKAQAVFAQADCHECLAEHYRRGIYFERDRFLVDVASEVIAYWDGGKGGTKYTVDYALKQGKTVFNISDELQ